MPHCVECNERPRAVLDRCQPCEDWRIVQAAGLDGPEYLVVTPACEDEILEIADRFPRLTLARFAHDLGLTHRRLRRHLDRARARRAARWREINNRAGRLRPGPGRPRQPLPGALPGQLQIEGA